MKLKFHTNKSQIYPNTPKGREVQPKAKTGWAMAHHGALNAHGLGLSNQAGEIMFEEC